jgi:arabinoxylan arabinofuranohydrolase
MKNASFSLFTWRLLLIMASTLIFGSEVTPLEKQMAQKAIKPLSENNPIIMHKFNADPCVLVYGDTVYVYATNDTQQAEFTMGKENNGYNKINSLNVYSSKDLVNWTDCGTIPVAGKKGPASWATNSWAPAIVCKKIKGKDKFFLYFADSGNGIGVVCSDSPTGPFKDPIKKPLISRKDPACADIVWLFDPAVIVDDDGTGYIYFGGGHHDDNPVNPKTARCAKLSDDMISLDGTPQVIDAPWLFEDSGINKINGKWVYTYCSNFAKRPEGDKTIPPTGTISYMTSDSPLGPFKYQGYTLLNPQVYYGPGGNNHHWIFNFKNKWYIAYHAQTEEKKIGFEKTGYRHIFINEFAINKDGSFPIQKVTKAGVSPVVPFNVYEEIPAATIHSFKNAAVTADQRIISTENGSWICIKGADLSASAKTAIFNTDKKSQGKIKLVVGNPENGTVICTAEINGDSNKATVTLPEKELSKVDLFLVFEGSIKLRSWRLEK